MTQNLEMFTAENQILDVITKYFTFETLNDLLRTVIPCTGMQCIKTQVLGNSCTIKDAFLTYIYLDTSIILVYQYTVPYILVESE